MVALQRKRNSSILSSSEKTVETLENEATIVHGINDHVAARYDRKFYIDKVLEVDDSDAKISFCEYAGTLSIGSIFREHEKRDEIWADFIDILHVVLVPTETKREKKFEKKLLS